MAGDQITTMHFDPETGLAGVEAALQAIKDALPGFDRHAARNDLQAATFRLRAPASVRLAAAASGAVAIEVAAPAK